jgi:type III pantothenate kinase
VSELLLAVDIGNSHSTVGLFNGSQLLNTWRLSTKTARTEDELWMVLGHTLITSGVQDHHRLSLSIASVVPAVTRIYAAIALSRFSRAALIIDYTHIKSLLVKYDPPTAVGADRLCGAVAALEKFGGPVIIADLGTATVFDAVTAKGDYLGGAIAPGVATAVEALHAAAALLPNVELRFPASVIGATTEAAIQSGILYGALDMIDGIVSRMKHELGGTATVVATGGFAELLKPYSRTIQHVVPNLVLDGIRLISNRQ